MAHVPVEEACPGEEAIAEFLIGGVVAPNARALEAHVSRCSSCRRLLSMLALADRATSSPPVDSIAPTLPLGSLGSDAAATPLQVGARIGRYVILDYLGAGGMGIVYTAYDPELDRKVALKLLRNDAGDSTDDQSPLDPRPIHGLLLEEAKAMARLAHRNVVTVFDVGSVDDRVFLAMELIEGVTLAGWLRAERRQHSAILDAFVAAGRGLAAAHAAGLIHRDFKPDNVLVGNDGRVCVTDFGLARQELAAPAAAAPGRAKQAQDSARSTATSIVGTLPYMAPELYLGRRADARADQFSFAVALHEALYGGRPVVLPPAVTGGQAGAHRGITLRGRSRACRVLRRALRPRPEDRFVSMDELLAALAPPARGGRSIAAGALLVVTAAVAATGTYALHVRAVAERRADLIGHLRGLAPELRTMVRSAHMLPAHDIRTVREQVRRVMREVEQQLATGGGTGVRALSTFVLGEARRSLGDHAGALTLLEAAWAAGQRGPDIDAALGGELGLAYESQFERLEHTAPSAGRAAQIQAIEQRYRDPAMAHLRAALDARTGSPTYLQAQIAFHQHRYAEASRGAHAAFAETPSFYEAGMLEARSRNAAGEELAAANQRDPAVAEFAAARQIFGRVLEIARSDDEAWLAYGEMVYAQAIKLAGGGELPTELRDAASAALRTAAQINPDSGKAVLREARIEIGQGNIDVILGRNPNLHVDRALVLVEAARQREVDAIEIDALRCVAYWERGVHAGQHAIDPHDVYARAAAACERAAASSADADSYLSLGVIYQSIAAYDGAHGRDPIRDFERGARSLRAALVINDVPHTHYALARLWTKLAQYQGSHGVDPQRAVADALAEYRTTLQQSAARLDAWAGMSDAIAVRAQLQLDRGHDVQPTLADARAALDHALAIEPSFVPAIRSRIVLAEIEARALLGRGDDPKPALARMRADLQQLAAQLPDDGSAHLSRCRMELLAAQWELAHGGTVERRLSRAEAEAVRARDRDAASAAAWTVSAELEVVRAAAARPARSRASAAAIARSRAHIDHALAIDPQNARALQIRDQLTVRPSGNKFLRDSRAL